MVKALYVFGISSIPVLAVSAILLTGRLGQGFETSVSTPPTQAVNVLPSVNLPFGNLRQPKAREPSIKVKTRVMLVSRAILEEQRLRYDLKIPGHHVRPVSDDTENAATVIDDSALIELLEGAKSDPQTHIYEPEPQSVPDEESVFDCLSMPYRDPPKYLPEGLSAAVINGVSLAYTPKVSEDNRKVVFTPISIKRADYAAGTAQANATIKTTNKELPTAKVTVPDGGILLIDGGPVKAKPSEKTASRQLLVLVRPQVIARK